MKKKIIYVVLGLLILVGISTSLVIHKSSNSFIISNVNLSEFIHQEYEGYIGEYFLNNKKQYMGADIGNNDGGIYLLERNYNTQSHIMYICSKPLNETKDYYLFRCNIAYSENTQDLFLKLEMAYLDESKKDKIVYVSIGDNRDCIEKYTSPRDFKKYCNPQTNENITYLKLYNLHF